MAQIDTSDCLASTIACEEPFQSARNRKFVNDLRCFLVHLILFVRLNGRDDWESRAYANQGAWSSASHPRRRLTGLPLGLKTSQFSTGFKVSGECS